MSRDAIGVALSLMNRLSGLPLVDQLGARKWLEKAAFHTTKVGFQAGTTISRQFNKIPLLKEPARLDAPKTQSQLFDFSINDEQIMIQDNVKRFSNEVLRKTAADADEQCETSQPVMEQAQDLGLVYYCIPESLGGAGSERSPITNMIIAEALAHGDLGQAVALLCSFGAANAISHWGTAAQQSRYLPAFLDEKPLQAVIAVNEPAALFDPNQLNTQATKHASGFTITGEKSLVPLAVSAELFLIAAEIPNEGPAFFLIESSTPGLSISNNRGMGIRAANMANLKLDQVEVSSDARLGDDQFSYQQFIDYCRLGWCSLAIGASQATLDYVIPYCNEREAFGEPISHRQGVAFMVADMGIELEGMRVITQRGVSQAEHGLDFHQQTYLAKLACGERAMQIGTDGVQLLGGHGFTKEHPVERWYRDLRSIALMEGVIHL